MDCHADQGGAGDVEGRLVSLSLSGPRGWVLTWLRKGVEKVVPQPVRSSRPAQNTAAGLESPDQVLLGLGAEVGQVGKGWEGGQRTCILCPRPSVCLSVSAGRSTGPWAV